MPTQYAEGVRRLRKWRGMLAMFLVMAPAVASASIGACDGPLAQTLHPAAHAATDARAYWLDAQTIRWPGMPADGRYRLHASDDARLQATPGAAVRGGKAIALEPAPSSPGTPVRFQYTGQGVELRLPAGARSRLPGLLRGQLLIAREDQRGRVLDATYLQSPAALDVLYADADSDPAPLGALPSSDATAFRLWAPTARAVSACVYRDGSGRAMEHLPLTRDARTGIWNGAVARDLRSRYYTYLVEVFVPGVGIVRNRVTDPYAVSLTTDSTRGYIADLEDAALKPAGWDQAPRPAALASNTDMALYELHVRDFSLGDASVPLAHRGKYMAFAEPDSAGMRHLRMLGAAGITDVHLLPVFDLATVPEADCVAPQIPRAAADSPLQAAAVEAVAARDCFNWGYDPFHFNAPEGSYATNASDGAVRIREFRAMVQALHAAGLRVGMDVVYNHTTASGQSPRSVLDRIVPGYYQRLNAKGEVERSTCCDNTATEHRMMARLMRDSVALWVRHYRIDSIRFDLMGHQPRDAMVEVQRAANAAAGRNIPLVGEGWNFGEIAGNKRFVQASQGQLDGTGIATFSDRARDAMRGGGCCDGVADIIANQGWLNGLHAQPNASAASRASRKDLMHAADLARAGLAGTLRDYRMQFADGRIAPLSALDYKGQPAGYASQPGEVVNYVENHDNPTLWDVHALKLPLDTSAEQRAQAQLLGAAFVAFAQGVPYFHAGMEVLRSKSLDRNSFDSGDWFNRLDWTYTDNGFGAGLPPGKDNANDRALMAAFLRNPNAKPSPAQITWMRDAFRDLLRIRASTPLLRLRDAGEVQRHLRFLNTGPTQDPQVLVGHLDGAGHDGPQREVLYLLNTAPEARTLGLRQLAGKRFALHPVQADASAADGRIRRQARFDAGTGAATVPARSAVVFVIPRE